MKAGIHPNYIDTKIVCACGTEYPTRSIKAEIHVEICGACHPFFTGKQKIVDTEGRVEKFMQRYGKKLQEQKEA
ncbi:MAG: 50S ribosomal protein L31 [Armatimonadota bacterium]